MVGDPEASVVVATRNRAESLSGLVAAILAQSGVGATEMVIVDDASTDDTWEVLSALSRENRHLLTHRLDRHAGPAFARNVGWRMARSSVIAFTDDDCVPQPGWLAALLAAHAEGADVVQGSTVPDIETYGDRGTFSHWIEVPAFSHLYEACNVSYKRALLRKLGGFDESFGTSRGGAPNGEDADLGWRAAESGAQCVFVIDAVVVHPVGQSSFGLSVKSRLRSYRMVYFVAQHPAFRRYLPHRYFFQRAHPAALGLLLSWLPFLASRSRPLAVLGCAGTFPYVHFRWKVERLPGRRRYLPVITLGAWLVDIADVMVLAAGSARWRSLLL